MASIVTLPGIKTQFVAGLNWRHAPKKPTRSELRKLSEQVGRWGVVHLTAQAKNERKTEGKDVGVGIGTCDMIEGLTGKATSVRSLAAAIAEQLPQPWMHVFDLGDGRFWLIAVRDHGFVVPGGDVIGGYEEVSRYAEEFASSLTWNSITSSIEDLIDMARSGAKVPPLSDLQRNPWVPVFWAGGAAALSLCGVAVGAYFQHQDAVQEQQLQQLRKAEIRASHRASAEKDARILPWANEPMMAETLRACQEAWHTQDMARKGWVLKNWGCQTDATGVSVQAQWMRQGGLAIDAPGTLLAGGEESTERIKTAYGFSEPIPLALEATAAERAVRTVAQLYGADLKLTANAIPPVVKNGVTVPRIWGSSTALFHLPAAPWEYGISRGMSALPGLRLKSIEWSSKSEAWTVNASLYSMLATLPEDEPDGVRAHRGGASGVYARGVKNPTASTLASRKEGGADVAGTSPLSGSGVRGGWGDAVAGARSVVTPHAAPVTHADQWDAADGRAVVDRRVAAAAASMSNTQSTSQPESQFAPRLPASDLDAAWDNNGRSTTPVVNSADSAQTHSAATAPVSPIAVPGLPVLGLGGKS
ncbi:type 4b pilus protein PilO2 [Paraburkholderia sp. J8-2]|uniref:type 4b pilus protein PilO2 n=1 Tax=Paraburkholderia sp. J8-2 TaxID=2805440 RepID=UPI002AB70FC7|nr:type 4b pilus protein PilO2 [Paraburkholderia sp. J8-2]